MAINPQAAFSNGNVMRQLRELEARISAIENGRSLESSSIGEGGLRIHAGGGLRIHEGGDINVEDGGSVNVRDGGSVRVTDGVLAAADAEGDVFRVDPRVPEIFMRPELISAVARLVIADVIFSAQVPSYQVTSSTSYTDLATAGPTLTDIEISDAGKMLVMVSAHADAGINTASGQLNEFAYMSYEISGPTNRSANDADALVAGFGADPTSGTIAAGTFSNATKVVPETGLAPGTYSVTAKYRVDATLGGTPSATFGDRSLTVIAF